MKYQIQHLKGEKKKKKEQGKQKYEIVDSKNKSKEKRKKEKPADNNSKHRQGLRAKFGSIKRRKRRPNNLVY